MNNILVLSQTGFTVIPTIIGIGTRQEIMVIGDKLKALMDKHNMDKENLIVAVGNSYRDNIERILANQEIPKPKMIEKLESVFGVEKDYFKDKELNNVIVVNGGNVIAKYDTNARALEVKDDLLKKQAEAWISGKKDIYTMPEK